MKIYSGRLSGNTDERLSEINSSISYDSKMVLCDIQGSIAHAKMLGKTKVIAASDAEAIVEELEKIAREIESGKLAVDMSAEDIHSFIEATLTERIGTPGKMLHTARSRNDQVCLDLRMFLAQHELNITALLKELIETLCETASLHLNTVMPGYTHLQRAQPVTLAHYLMAYAQMFARDIQRISQCRERTLVMPLGSGALAGTVYPIDREYVKELLGFEKISANSMDAVSDRDFALELAFDLSLIMEHLSRFCEEIILWCSSEFSFMSLSDDFSTGSSIMPQKKNPDTPELIRGKTGRVYGSLMSLLTVMKGLPLAYNKDMQEDKEAIFDAAETVEKCLAAFIPMIACASFNVKNMERATHRGFVNATDCADYLVQKGEAFRDAYKTVGELVAYCAENDKGLGGLTIEEYKRFNKKFDKDIYEAIDILNCVKKRNIPGGPSPEAVEKQIADMTEYIKDC